MLKEIKRFFNSRKIMKKALKDNEEYLKSFNFLDFDTNVWTIDKLQDLSDGYIEYSFIAFTSSGFIEGVLSSKRWSQRYVFDSITVYSNAFIFWDSLGEYVVRANKDAPREVVEYYLKGHFSEYYYKDWINGELEVVLSFGVLDQSIKYIMEEY